MVEEFRDSKYMRRGPEFRIVGSAPQDKKEAERRKLEAAFHDHTSSIENAFTSADAQRLKVLEYPKSDKEIALIDFANQETNSCMREAGVEPYDVPASNQHIVPREVFSLYGTHERTVAQTIRPLQGTIYDAALVRGNLVHFGTTAQHEIDHLKEYFVSQMHGGERSRVYRGGVETVSVKTNYRGQKLVHFRGLNEAIMVTQQKRSMRRMLELPALAEEKKWLDSPEAMERRHKVATTVGVPEDEFLWIGKTDKDCITFGYYLERQTLKYVCEQIHQVFRNDYISPEDVLKEFQSARYTGHLVAISRLVDKTFGEGSFRLLGQMIGDDGETAEFVLAALKKKRRTKTTDVRVPTFLKKTTQ